MYPEKTYKVLWRKDDGLYVDTIKSEFSPEIKDGDLIFYNFGEVQSAYARGVWIQVNNNGVV